MGISIYQDYSRFYKGTEQLKSYGNAASKKDTLVKYEFNTTDEKGNKVMDKMSKEESFRIMNDIASQYGDNVIVEFSGDALTALEQYGKGLLGEPEEREPIPTKPLEGVRAFTDEEWEAIQEKSARLGDDMVAIMRDVDSSAYKEYQRISEEGNASGTREGMTAGFRYLYKWMQKKANENPNWLEEYKAAKKTEQDVKVKDSESKLSKKAAALLERLRKTYGDYDFIVGNAGDDLRSLVKNSSKEFSVIFSTSELERMASDEKYAQEKIDAMKGAIRMSRQINEQYGFESAFAGNGVKLTKFGISFNADGSTSFFAELEKSSAAQREYIEKQREEKRTQKKEEAKEAEREKQQERLGRQQTLVQADSIEELLEKIRKVSRNTAYEEREPENGTRFDFSI